MGLAGEAACASGLQCKTPTAAAALLPLLPLRHARPDGANPRGVSLPFFCASAPEMFYILQMRKLVAKVRDPAGRRWGAGSLPTHGNACVHAAACTLQLAPERTWAALAAAACSTHTRRLGGEPFHCSLSPIPSWQQRLPCIALSDFMPACSLPSAPSAAAHCAAAACRCPLSPLCTLACLLHMADAQAAKQKEEDELQQLKQQQQQDGSSSTAAAAASAAGNGVSLSAAQ